MRKNRLIAMMLAILASVAFTVGSAVPAAAADEEYNKAVSRTNWGAWDVCVDSGTVNGKTLAKACFKKHGDYFFVKDELADGDSVYVLWTNQLRTSSGGWATYREGRCEFYGGNPNWGQCNKDFYENTTYPNAFGTRGSRITIRACANRAWETDKCGGWTTVLNDA